MTINEAISKFNSSDYGPGRKIVAYADYKDGYILIPSTIDGDVGIVETVQYYVDSRGKVFPAHPLLFRFNRDSIKKI